MAVLLMPYYDSWCSKCPPSSFTQALSRTRHCLTAASTIFWLSRLHSSTRRTFRCYYYYMVFISRCNMYQHHTAEIQDNRRINIAEQGSTVNTVLWVAYTEQMCLEIGFKHSKWLLEFKWRRQCIPVTWARHSKRAAAVGFCSAPRDHKVANGSRAISGGTSITVRQPGTILRQVTGCPTMQAFKDSSTQFKRNTFSNAQPMQLIT